MSDGDFEVGDEIPVTLLRAIDAVCSEFDRQWRAGLSPRIEDVLEQIPAPGRERGLCDLIEQEIGLRRGSGETVGIESYLARFSGHETLVRKAFAHANPTCVISNPGPSAAPPCVPAMSTAPSAEKVPVALGRFQIEKQIGKGTFGIVYLATDPTFPRHVALKVPRPERVRTTEQRRAFIRDAQYAAKLKHDGVVTIYEIDTTGELPIIVQEYMAGGDLKQRLKAGGVTCRQAVAWMIPIAEAVTAAHQKDILHRDLKPANILLDESGQPHVADFGLALHEREQQKHRDEFAGTLPYMSPEQVRCESNRLDGRSDTWSLGVILYEMLTGRRPFLGTPDEVAEQIKYRDPRPPREVQPDVPAELQRICLKCLEKPAARRYSTVLDLARELVQWQFDEQRKANEKRKSPRSRKDGQPPAAEPPVIEKPLRIVPQGLRSFEARDSDFFLELLPGPRDRNGLPDSVRFWKALIEETDPAQTFAVGVLHGPSGCGKSSLMKAGILPNLASHILPAFVEATAADTEVRLLGSLRHLFPEIPQRLPLPDVLAGVRDGDWGTSRAKLLIVLDQFEQWLHAGNLQGPSQLVDALRHCDGERLQCLVLVREDFWTGINRFMDQLEIPLQEQRNAMQVDRFDRFHARRVLEQFGRAYGRLPEPPAPLTREQEQFLDAAIEQLSEEGRVICVRLALFGEMFKDKAWTPAELRAAGGAAGLGVTFLEETFAAKAAPEANRRHRQAVQKLFVELLPGAETDIKGSMQTRAALQQACGYGEKPRAFGELMQILDEQLRLVTPTDPEGHVDLEVSERARPDGAPQYYQFTHDYLVPSVRDWLKLKDGETARGRARQLLIERTSLYDARPEDRHLPSLPEHVRIRFLTNRRQQTAAQRKMLSRAARVHGIRASLALLLMIAFLWGAYDAYGNLRSAGLVGNVVSGNMAEQETLAGNLIPFRRWAVPKLVEVANSGGSPAEILKAKLALVRLSDNDAKRIEWLFERLLEAPAEDVPVIAQFLRPHKTALSERLWKTVAEPRDPRHRLRAAAALALFEPGATAWANWSAEIAGELVQVPTFEAKTWAVSLRPARQWLVAPLKDAFLAEASTERVNALTADLLADYVSDTETLAALVERASHEQLAILVPAILKQGDQLVPYLREILNREAVGIWPSEPPTNSWPAPPSWVKRKMEEVDGFLSKQWGLCHSLPIDEFARVAAELQTAGYRPNRLRPYRRESETLVAVTWLRDGRHWDWSHNRTADELRLESEKSRKSGLIPLDISADPQSSSNGAGADNYTVLWVERSGEVIDSQICLSLPEDEHRAEIQRLKAKSFVPLTNLKNGGSDDEMFSSVLWKLSGGFKSHECQDESQEEIASQADNGWYHSDIRIMVAADGSTRYSATWWDFGGWSSKCEWDLSIKEHLASCRRYDEIGYRPIVVTAAWQPHLRQLVCASCWHRPVATEESLGDVARRRANAALALLHLGHSADVWPLLRQSTDPTVRSWLIHAFPRCGIKSELLWQRLHSDDDSFVRQALLLSLSQFPDTPVRIASSAGTMPFLTGLYELDADPGVHSAAGHLLKKTGAREFAATPEVEPLVAGRRWSLTEHGHTLVHIDGPVQFLMGSPPLERHRDSEIELQHRVRIPRSFAIGQTEITVAQYLEFDPNYDYPRAYAADLNCPVTGISYFDALRYCRWLSEKEGFKNHECCYPRADEIGEGMTFPGDLLERAGFRLPTDAEWEFACRAGTATPRHFGIADELLRDYAWMSNNSKYHLWPVGSLLPNDLGLFDMHGNAMELCQDAYRRLERPPQGTVRVDQLDVPAMNSADARIWRSGAILYQPAEARSGHRDYGFLESRFPFLGFRIARTVSR